MVHVKMNQTINSREHALGYSKLMYRKNTKDVPTKRIIIRHDL